ncbi:MAG: peptidylprolyl isomerase [Bacillota bacterium]|nr:peptidylprolyl isomerase [Bacillota bacterium]
MKKFNTVIFILILCLALVGGSLSILAQEKDVVATINGVEISKAEYYEVLESQYGPYVLDELVKKLLVQQKAAALGIEISDEEFAGFYDMILSQLGGPAGLQAFLAQNNATEEQFIDQLHWNILIGKLSTSEVEVTEDKLVDWFEQNKQYYDKPFTVEVSHILVEDEDDANAIIDQLENGAEFAELAMEKSVDHGSAARGGYIGEIAKGDTVPEFEEAAFSLPIDEYGLAKSNFGWHIVLVHSQSEAIEATFEDVREFVEEDYRSEKALDAQSYLTKLELEADIKLFQ